MNHLSHTRYLVRRLAMLIGGGVSTQRVWGVLEQDPRVGTTAAAVTRGIEQGGGVPMVLSRMGLHSLAGVWQVSETAGSPLAAALDHLATQLDAVADAARKRSVAFAGPRATMRLVMWLPVVGIGFSYLLGFDPLQSLFGSPVGWGLVSVGGALMGVGMFWSTRMVSRSARSDTFHGYEIELLLVALAGGMNLTQARLTAADALESFPVPGASLVSLLSLQSPLNQTLELATAAGVSVVDVLTAEATDSRRAAASALDEAAARLGVRLMLPLGVCVLPAFVLLSVAPMLLSVFRQTQLG